ncbi:MAG: glycosyltransferase family 2 protein [Candidatus Edwardsbacteria bacterium]|nr:glycosyltransferase family 2 protein [Candidatus Edwardsbacteria bacterium]
MDNKITVIMPTYNRASTICRAIDSVLNQTYKDIEILVIDDGSKDNTLEIIGKYKDNRIKIIKHNTNKGVISAKNTGLDKATGKWVTHVDSDDEIVPECFAILLDALKTDPNINHINCNVVNYETGKLMASGLEADMFLDENKLMTKVKGPLWGIIKTELYGDKRFAEGLPEGVLGVQIGDLSLRYYINKGLYIYHLEGNDRVCKAVYTKEKNIKTYRALLNETYYLNKIKKYQPGEYYAICLKGIININTQKGERENINNYYRMLKESDAPKIIKISGFVLTKLSPRVIEWLIKLKNLLRDMQYKVRLKQIKNKII